MVQPVFYCHLEKHFDFHSVNLGEVLALPVNVAQPAEIQYSKRRRVRTDQFLVPRVLGNVSDSECDFSVVECL